MLTLKPTKKTTSIDVIFKLLKAINVKVNKNSLSENLHSHPEYPSLLSISDYLNEIKVDNKTYRIKDEDYDSSAMRFPFLTHLWINGGSFIIVHEISSGRVTYSNEKNDKISLPEESFKEVWSKVMLIPKANKLSGQHDYFSKDLKDYFNLSKVPLLFTITILSILYVLNTQSQFINLAYISVLFFKFFGVIVSLTLLLQSININNSFIQNLCGVGDKNQCNEILKSDAANVFSWLSWSEIGCLYFMGSFLILLFDPGSIGILFLLNTLTLPYTFYSFYYQYRRKNWCVLCTMVQIILWCEFISNLVALKLSVFTFPPTTTPSETISFYLLYLLPFIIPIILWAIIKPHLLKSSEHKGLIEQLKKFKFNSDVFDKILRDQSPYETANNLSNITLGNSNAEKTITVVSNAFCGPCSLAHQVLVDLLSNRNDIKANLIFTSYDENSKNFTKHINALNLIHPEEIIHEALDIWFKQKNKNFEAWATKYPVNISESIFPIITAQEKWLDHAEIEYTPTIFINEHKLPYPYQLEDIKYLIP